jgi:hypothetical protein
LENLVRINLSRAVSAGLLVSLALASAGCGSEAKSTSAATASAAATASPDGTAAAPLTDAQLKAALLTDADLPAGFKADPAATVDGDKDGGFVSGDQACKTMGDITDRIDSKKTDPGQVGYATVSLTKESGPVFFAEQLISYGSGQTRKVYDELASATAQCKKFTADVATNTKATLTQSPFPALSVGDDAQAARFVADVQGTTMQLDQVVVRVGDTIVLVYGMFLGNPDASLTRQVAEKAVAKLGA